MIGSNLSSRDRDGLVNRYRERFSQYGYHPASLGWPKGKQDVRFDTLTQPFDLSRKTVLDMGCGFGDLFDFIERKRAGDFVYYGCDIVDEFINEAKIRHANKDNTKFFLTDMLNPDFYVDCDIVFASGSLNAKFTDIDNYVFAYNAMTKALEMSKEGFAFDFISDKVDWKYDHNFYYNAGRILEAAYKLSRNVVLRNDVMPFEFSIYVFKNDSFEQHDTLFNLYKELNHYE